mmetsp:Transcript_63989/g.74963  ORF Transcript_63989/g.74963 Transcript_63989/m.74963 type:complete len:383 (-) Transcript_63989:185-1333(-)
MYSPPQAPPNVPMHVELSRRLRDIRDCYEESLQSPSGRNSSMKAFFNTFIANIEQRFNEGKSTLEECNNLKGAFAETASIFENAEEDEDAEMEKTVRYSFKHSDHGDITITSEGWRHWRKATTDDIGMIVLNINNYDINHNQDGIFGELDDTEDEPDEEFPESINQVALVNLQNGELYTSSFALFGVWEDLRVVPDQVLSGVKNEAPPGSFFSGVVNTISTKWTPAPEEQVWYEHPKCKGRHHGDFEYFVLKRRFGDGFAFENAEAHLDKEWKIWQDRGRFAYWDPVKNKFICEGERLRSEHWFHNGDGSAQQRWYYNQLEILELHGGLESVPLKCDETGRMIYKEIDELEEPVITNVYTSGQTVSDKFSQAEKDGSILDLR